MTNKREMKRQQEMKRKHLEQIGNLYRNELRHHYWKTIVQVVKEIMARPAGSGCATECD